MRTYDTLAIKGLLPFPVQDANKYTRGRFLVVGGSARYPGAACLAALAGQRMGAGYTQVVCAPESVPVVQMRQSSLVVASWDAWRPDDEPVFRPEKPWACSIGSGFDANDVVGVALLHDALRTLEAPVLVDGGAISALASVAGLEESRARFDRGCVTVATPHAGEAARMARAALIDEGMPPIQLCTELARAYRCVVALKGPVTFVSNGESAVSLSGGTSALAKAGTGDVLAGMIGALLAQGLDASDACVLGVTLHSLAGICASDKYTSICVTPEDVIDALPEAIDRLASL